MLETLPTRLAPDWTFTQPPLSPTTLVGFYPTVSPLALGSALRLYSGWEYSLLQLSSSDDCASDALTCRQAILPFTVPCGPIQD